MADLTHVPFHFWLYAVYAACSTGPGLHQGKLGQRRQFIPPGQMQKHGLVGGVYGAGCLGQGNMSRCIIGRHDLVANVKSQDWVLIVMLTNSPGEGLAAACRLG